MPLKLKTKTFVACIAAALVAAMLIGCSSSGEATPAKANEGAKQTIQKKGEDR
jgi:outer membrane biogenesis lipoprotein LolB